MTVLYIHCNNTGKIHAERHVHTVFQLFYIHLCTHFYLRLGQNNLISCFSNILARNLKLEAGKKIKIKVNAIH